MPLVKLGVKQKPPKADELPDHLKKHIEKSKIDLDKKEDKSKSDKKS